MQYLSGASTDGAKRMDALATEIETLKAQLAAGSIKDAIDSYIRADDETKRDQERASSAGGDRAAPAASASRLQ